MDVRGRFGGAVGRGRVGERPGRVAGGGRCFELAVDREPEVSEMDQDQSDHHHADNREQQGERGCAPSLRRVARGELDDGTEDSRL